MINKYTKIILFTTLLLFVSSDARSAFFPSDIEFFVGSGANEAYFVLDWNNSLTPGALAWGYRWDGVATGLDMLLAIVNADNRLFHLAHPSFNTPAFYGAFAFGYDLVNDGSGFSPGAPTNVFTEIGVANNPLNHYAEGWNTGYWSYWTEDGNNPYSGGSWNFSMIGVGARALANGSWDGWQYAPGFAAAEPGVPVAAPIPEPSAVIVLVFAFGLLCAFRFGKKKNASCARK